MFSQLGPLFKTQFRKTENNDARQHIPHQEHDAAQKKNQQQDDKKEAPKWEDEASVSVASLRVFLIDFLKTLPGAENLDDFETPSAQNIQTRPHEKQRPSNTQNAKAVRAYQTMAQHAQGPEDAPKAPSISDTKKPPQTIESKEYRDIYTLIQDLEILAQKGIKELLIYKSETFVQSLKTAVDKEKIRLNI